MLDQYRRDFADFNTACAREYYLFQSGQKTTLEIAPIYERYGHLFDRDLVESLKSRLSDSDISESERLSIGRLLAFAIEQFLEDSVKELTEQISDHEAASTIEWQGRPITFQDLTVNIANEPDRHRRRELYRRRLAAIDGANDLRAARLLKLHQTAFSLGYSSYRNLFEEVRKLDYTTIAGQVAQVLASTETTYMKRLDEVLRRHLGLGVGDAQRSDAIYLLNLTNFDERFPSQLMLRVYRDTMAGLGVKVDSQSNISIDSESRPRKNPRAFCMPISIPEEIKLVIRPAGGQSDFQAFLHESGHAQHYGWTSSDLSPEFKYTGDYALTETYAFLFNHLVSDKSWLASFLGMKDSDEFVRSVMLARLVTVRRYVAKLSYENALHVSDDLAASSSQYAAYQTAATHFKTEPEEFLFDLDDGFYSASYLRAWGFEVSLREYLKTKFGSQWWSSKRAGDFLKEIWETGDRYTADEMASQIGVAPISFELLIEEFNTILR